MIEKVTTTGDVGRLRIRDFTDEGSGNVELWVQSLSPVAVPQLPWTFSRDQFMDGWKSFNFQNTTMWQRLSIVHVGTNVQKFTLHLGPTGTSQLGGPTDLEINVAGYIPAEGPGGTSKLVHIKVGGVWRRAAPFVKDNGVWKPAEPFVRGERGWSKLS